MDDFEPTTDFPDVIDGDDRAVASTAKSRDEQVQRRRKLVLRWLALGAVLALIAQGFPPVRSIVAVLAGYAIIHIGFIAIGAMARPIPEAPPPGELRRVKLVYRCTTCGSELRMTLANDHVPEAPRHCADDMELITDLEDVI
ncbi:MAG: hypothetical protein ACRBI6_07755 [Acidimicrobiales bacterium]